METKKHVLFVLLLAVTTTLWAQTAPKGTKRYHIPFALTPHNNITVHTVLNGKDTVLLMLHTASSSVTLTEEGVHKTHGLHFTRTDSVNSWGGTHTSRYSEGNTFSIGKHTWQNIPVWENKNSGPGTDGKFGLDFFEGQAVEINFRQSRLCISNRLPGKAKRYQKLKLHTRDDMLFIDAACEIDGQTYPNRFLIHSGYSGTVLLDDQFAADRQLAQKIRITETQVLKDSYGGILNVQKGILPALIIGNERLAEVPVGFFEGSVGRQKISVLGGGLLKRFNWIVDAKREYIYLKPNKT